MSVLSRIQKRRAYEMEFDGGKIRLRALTFDEIGASQKFASDPLGTMFVVGKALLEDDGSPAFTQGEETDQAFAERIKAGVATDIANEIMQMVIRVSNGKSQDLLVKN